LAVGKPIVFPYPSPRITLPVMDIIPQLYSGFGELSIMQKNYGSTEETQ